MRRYYAKQYEQSYYRSRPYHYLSSTHCSHDDSFRAGEDRLRGSYSLFDGSCWSVGCEYSTESSFTLSASPDRSATAKLARGDFAIDECAPGVVPGTLTSCTNNPNASNYSTACTCSTTTAYITASRTTCVHAPSTGCKKLWGYNEYAHGAAIAQARKSRLLSVSNLL